MNYTLDGHDVLIHGEQLRRLVRKLKYCVLVIIVLDKKFVMPVCTRVIKSLFFEDENAEENTKSFFSWGYDVLIEKIFEICFKRGRQIYRYGMESLTSELSALSVAERDVKVEPRLEITSIPIWYKIPEIPSKTYLNLIKPLYDIIEGKKTSKSEADIFAQQGWIYFHKMTREKWEEEHKKIQIERAWTMAWGDFHQNLMGSFPGWENYKKGHITGCDIGKEDNTCVCEVKNNTNTMNSSSKESVMKKLKHQKNLGKRAILVVINGDIKKIIKDGIETISGKDFYHELSGRPTFMDELLLTTNESFKKYKTFDALKTAIETA